MIAPTDLVPDALDRGEDYEHTLTRLSALASRFDDDTPAYGDRRWDLIVEELRREYSPPENEPIWDFARGLADVVGAEAPIFVTVHDKYDKIFERRVPVEAGEDLLRSIISQAERVRDERAEQKMSAKREAARRAADEEVKRLVVETEAETEARVRAEEDDLLAADIDQINDSMLTDQKRAA